MRELVPKFLAKGAEKCNPGSSGRLKSLKMLLVIVFTPTFPLYINDLRASVNRSFCFFATLTKITKYYSHFKQNGFSKKLSIWVTNRIIKMSVQKC